MEQVEVEILGQVMTAQYGTLGADDILKTDAAFAKHLVDDCKAAKYVKAKAIKAPAKPAKAESKAKVPMSKQAVAQDVASVPAAPEGADEKSADVSTDRQ